MILPSFSCPSSKKLVTEEAMAMVGYLEQLNLARENNQHMSSSLSTGSFLPQKMNARRVASCQDPVQNSRKRHSKNDLLDIYMECDTDDFQSSLSGGKKIRVDVATNFPAMSWSACSTRSGHHIHAGNGTPTSSHSLDVISGSCAMTEGCGETQRSTVGSSCDSELMIEPLKLSTSPEGRTNHRDDSSYSPSSSSPSVLDTSTNLPPTGVSHIWVAPELQSFCSSQNPPLPSGIVKEIR